MKNNNICYSPVNDCGGFGGNWYWNPFIPHGINGGNGFGLFLFGDVSSNPVTTTNIYIYIQQMQ